MTTCDATIARIADEFLAREKAGWEEWMLERLDVNKTFRLVWEGYCRSQLDRDWFDRHANHDAIRR